MKEAWWVLPTGAGVVSGAFAYTLGRLWKASPRPHLLAWALALLLFAIASIAAGASMLANWTSTSFRLYYLFGAIVNVPVLAIGTIYLLGPRKFGHVCAVVVAIASLFAAIVVFRADLDTAGLRVEGIPSSRDVAPELPRTLSRYFSFGGFFVVVGGALWSAWRLARKREERLRRLALANLLIATGTFVVAVGSGFARYGQGALLALGLVVGVSLMFLGFLMTRPRSA
ncbi:MAG TPA: hypothetical protein VHJ82_08925 [Actinomycetota bacterium]|nr:hypothetical protein [Actinomycetota bacterium]